MIESLLVANRGEIACRIFRTARRLGVRTIAVYSQADAGARHVREADTAVCIGAAAPRESYLNIGRILEAADATGARAIHPGYGFLSENAAFAAACTQAGRIFVGPPAAAIEAMGSKIVAKARMRAAGVPVLPGYDGAAQDLPLLQEQARRLSLPLMIKPAAGGGGKGMHIVTEAAQIPAALASARRLAESAFGDGTLLLERFLPAPRHVEVQVFADGLGQVIHLGDRDCSVQRRHQKVIEEAPAPQIPDEVRERLRSAAVLVAREIGYVGAGTVEFLFDSGEFYFMEMNTRLQVEHTVTEAITGLDLVEWQLRIASGDPLPLSQSQITFRGHAIEARVCAEDPRRDFLPSSGYLRWLGWPQGESIRVDAGFNSGDDVPSNYDSLLGKVIAWAPTRGEAAARLARALDDTYCVGVRTNERWLARILRDERFLAVRHSVAFLQESGATLTGSTEPGAEALILAALVAQRAAGGESGDGRWASDGLMGAGYRDGVRLGDSVTGAAPPHLGPREEPQRQSGPWDARDGFIPNLPARVGFAFRWRDRRHEVDLRFERERPAWATVDTGQAIVLADISRTAKEVGARVGSVLLRGHYWLEDPHLHIWLGAEHIELLLDDPRDREYSNSAATGSLTTPLPGVVVAVPVTAGQRVAAGAPLMVVEAMKMEHTITAPYAGTVKALHFAPGDRVPEGKALLDLTPD